MFGQTTPSEEKINIEEFRDKVLGCWTGKNIGGTLGAPMEGKREMTDVSFYIQELGGNPAPNDDLDLQLVWLLAVEQRGAYRLNERMLGEYWMRYISGRRCSASSILRACVHLRPVERVRHGQGKHRQRTLSAALRLLQQ